MLVPKGRENSPGETRLQRRTRPRKRPMFPGGNAGQGPGTARRSHPRRGRTVPGRVFITQPIPEPGPSLVRQVADDVGSHGGDRPLSTEELCAAVRGCDGVLCLLTDRIDAAVLEAARGCRIFAN